MNLKRKRILMLGWEFPPVISGGLGVATLGLCKAMAGLADMTMVIPKSVPGFSIPGINLIGLNNLSREQLEEIFQVKIAKNQSHKVETDYSGFSSYTQIPSDEYINELFYEVYQEEVEPFEIDELYKGNVVKKVIQFSRIAVKLGLTREFDVIHAHDWMTFLPAMELKLKTGKPLVLHVHSTEYDRAGAHSKNWVYDLERRAMELADAIIPVSYYTGQICIHHYGANPAKVFPVHNGIEGVEPTIKRRSMDGKYVIFFGRITMQKGPEYFVEAAKKVLQYLPNTKFVMAGNGDLLNAMIVKTASYGLGDKFFFTGFLNKKMLNELLAIADVYCMPSISEPFGLSAVEAAQYGIPTVISKTSGVFEVLKGSLAFEVWDVDKFSQYIIASIEYEGLRESVKLSNNASLKHITWENCANKVMEVYEKIHA